jgi:hypothetical protein
MTPKDKQQQRCQDHHKAGFEQNNRKGLQHHQDSANNSSDNYKIERFVDCWGDPMIKYLRKNVDQEYIDQQNSNKITNEWDGCQNYIVDLFLHGNCYKYVPAV